MICCEGGFAVPLLSSHTALLQVLQQGMYIEHFSNVHSADAQASAVLLPVTESREFVIFVL